MIWLYIDTGDAAKVSALAVRVAWLVAPSLVLFVVLPWLLHRGASFPLALAAGMAATVLAYWGTVVFLGRLGLRI